MELSGATIAAAGLGTGTVSAESAPWQSVKSPVDVTLFDVAKTARNDFVVGGGGTVVERTARGWKTVVNDGPTSNGNGLYGADVTDDGQRLWFVGASGAIGEYDVKTGDLNDHSAPNDATSNFNDVAVTGPEGDANVYVAGGSGTVYYSFENGASGTWNSVQVGQGNAIEAIDFYEGRKGHLVNGNANAFYSADGASWNKIGIADTNVSLYGIDSNGREDVWVAGGSGVVYRYAPNAQGQPEWTKTTIGEPGLRDIEVDAGDGYAAGNSGAVFDRVDGAWGRDETPTGQGLMAIADGENNDVAVGASGTIIATNPDAAAQPGSDDEQGDARRMKRVSTQTSESKSLTFTLQNVGDQSVTVEQWALNTNVPVDSVERSGAEVTLRADQVGSADSPDGYPVDDALRPLDSAAVYDPGTTGEAEFGLYDSGNVALTVEPAADRPSGEFVSATLEYGDGNRETFYFAVTNINS